MHATVRCVFALAFLAVAAAPHMVGAQESHYPNRPLRVIVPFAAGGGNDIYARLIGNKLSQLLGQPVINENRPGAGGRIAAEFVLSQPKDGYTLFLGATGGMSIAPAAFPKLSYHPTKSFIPLSMISDYPLILITNSDLPIRSVRELVEYAKKNPDKANYPASSPSFITASELLKLRTGMPGQMIPYKSTTEMVLSVIQGNVLFAIADGPAVIPQAQAGKVRALAITDTVRLEQMPDVPSMREEGFDEVSLRLFSGYFVSVGTPQPIVAKLEAALIKAIKDSEVQTKLQEMAVTPGGNSSDEFRAIINRDIAKITEIIRAANLKFEQ